MKSDMTVKFYYPLNGYESFSMEDYTLIVPAVAVGNVGQLAVDLLLSTLDVVLIGRLHNWKVFIPVVGAHPFLENDQRLVTSVQVYCCQEKKLVIVQQRAPITCNGKKEFCSLLTQWVEKQGFKQTILLSSCFAHFLIDQNMDQKKQFLATPSIDRKLFNELGLHPLTPKSNLTFEEDPNGTCNMPGSGVTHALYSKLSEVNCTVMALLWFCSEGDNIPDALSMVVTLDCLLHLLEGDSKTWKFPLSWSSLYGNAAPNLLY